jgi:acetyltransferase
MHNPLQPAVDRCAVVTRSWPLLYAQSLTVRPLVRADADLLVRFGLGLSAATRYQRFLGGGVRLNADLLERLLPAGPGPAVALVATVALDGREVPVGVARYAPLSDGETAEFAATVADAWQGQGIGRRLLERLVAIARERGLLALVGDTFAMNRPMLQLAHSLGFAIRPHRDGATLKRLERDLRDEFSAFAGRASPAPVSDA